MTDILGTKGWDRKGMEVFWGEIAPCDHVLQIYETDREFIDTLKVFVAAGLQENESVIVIATDEHLLALEQELRILGYDLFTLALKDQYIALSAHETLAQFMINGWPDENLFYHLVTSLLLRARKNGHRVRAFGEMVAVLWSQGHSGATVHLEHLWTRFCRSEEFALYCAYPKAGLTDDPFESLSEICNCHSKMIANLRDSSDLLVRENHVPHP